MFSIFFSTIITPNNAKYLNTYFHALLEIFVLADMHSHAHIYLCDPSSSKVPMFKSQPSPLTIC